MKQQLWFYNDWREQNLHRPKIPKIPDEQSAGFMHRPKIPKNPKIFRNYQARPWQSSKKSNLGNLGPVQVWWAFPIIEVTKSAQVQDSQDSWWTKCRIHAQAQDSQESQDILRTIKQDPDRVPKHLGILGNLRPVHESCTLFIGILGNLGPVQVLWRSYVKLCCLFEKMQFPFVFWWWTSELVQRVFIILWNFWKWRTGFWFCIIGCSFKTDDCNRNYFTYSVFKKHWYLQWFLHVPQVERWRWRYICDTPPPAGRPWEGGWPYVYINQVIQAVKFLSPNVGGHVYSHWKGHITIQKGHENAELPGR